MEITGAELFVKVYHCSDADITELFRISKVFGITIIDYDGSTVLLECTQTENRNDDLIILLKRKFVNRIEITRGGSVAVESISPIPFALSSSTSSLTALPPATTKNAPVSR